LKGPHFVWHGARANFQYTVSNEGTTLIAGVTTWRPNSGGPARRERVLLLPRGSRTVTARWQAEPFFGRYHPTVTLTPHAAGTGTWHVTYPAVWVLPPWWLIALIIIALSLPIARNRARAHARRRC